LHHAYQRGQPAVLDVDAFAVAPAGASGQPPPRHLHPARDST
jgi:hypothetical protein